MLRRQDKIRLIWLRKTGAVQCLLGTWLCRPELCFVMFSLWLYNSTRQVLLLSLVCNEVKEKVQSYVHKLTKVRDRIHIRPEAWLIGTTAFMHATQVWRPRFFPWKPKWNENIEYWKFSWPLHACHSTHKVFWRKKEVTLSTQINSHKMI